MRNAFSATLFRTIFPHCTVTKRAYSPLRGPAVYGTTWLAPSLDAVARGLSRQNTRAGAAPARFALRPCATSASVPSARKRLAARGARSLFHRSPQPPLHPLMSASVSVQYAARVAAGKIERDSAQQRIVDRLAKLETELGEQRLARKSSSLGWLFGSREPVPIKGLYMFGEVGCGKTMLMDLFFAASSVVRKRRVHFHEFMGEVHERVHVLRQKAKLGEASGEDPIGVVAAA